MNKQFYRIIMTKGINNKELLELAALAVGFIDDQTCDESELDSKGLHRNGQGIYWVNERNGLHNWNPLTDKSDCLQMEIDLALTIVPYGNEWIISTGKIRTYHKDRQRASTMAAAAIGKQMKDADSVRCD